MPILSGRCAVLLFACLAFVASAVPESPAVARETRGGSFLSQLGLPWQGSRASSRRARKPATAKKRPAAAKPAARRASKPAAKPAPRPVPKPVAEPAPTPVVETPAPPKRAEAGAPGVPMPPERPRDEPPAPPVETVARAEPDGATAPEPPKESPEASVPVPPERPDGDARTAALIPKAPLPDEKPAGPTPPDLPLPEASREEDADCRDLTSEGVAIFKPAELSDQPEICRTGALVELSGVRRKDGGVVELKPAATLRCAMARVVAAYVRNDLAPAAEASGAKLDAVNVAGSYACRGRNNVSGAKLSEHGRANALDISGFGLSGGRSVGVYAKELPELLGIVVKGAACTRFNTVLGPGSDEAHEDHLHVDLQPRRSNSRLCQWRPD